jgi:hypothetical protein
MQRQVSAFGGAEAQVGVLNLKNDSVTYKE